MGKKEAVHKQFVTHLIVQGMLMLLEDEIQVRCRHCDQALVRSCFAGAEELYRNQIEKETGARKNCKLSLDERESLPPPPGGEGPSCLGGVVLLCHDGKITVDNTVDSRLKLVMEQAKPTIRGLLFTK